MPLSTTGLQEGDFTTLRVLKNGVMQNVLSLTASGSPDIPLGGLIVAHTAGLQTQLNAKATTSALSAAAQSLGGEIDALETGVTAVGAAVGEPRRRGGDQGYSERVGCDQRSPQRCVCEYKRFGGEPQ